MPRTAEYSLGERARPRRVGRVAVALAGSIVAGGAGAAAAGAVPLDPPTGGASAAVEHTPVVSFSAYGAPAPQVERIACRTGCGSAGAARPGALVRVAGQRVRAVAEVVFLAGTGEADDTSAAPVRAGRRAITVRVPHRAASGPVALVLADGTRSVPSSAALVVEPTAPLAPAGTIDAEVQGRTVFYDAERPAELSFVLGGAAPATVAVELVREDDGEVVRSWTRTGVPPGIAQTVTWNGTAGGRVQRDGEYRFRVRAVEPATPTAPSAPAGDAPNGGGASAPTAGAPASTASSSAAGSQASATTPAAGLADEVATPADPGGATGASGPAGDGSGASDAGTPTPAAGSPDPTGAAGVTTTDEPIGSAAETVVTIAASDDERGAFTFLRHRFPIAGAHTYGIGGAVFGGGRGHQGQDVFAECGTPVVAARGGTVAFEQYEGNAGHYVVLDGAGTDVDHAYMHLRDEALVDVGDRVRTGRLIGFVGNSGRADGCHLHFEMWSAPGWYEGGAPFDPLPRLRAWDARS